MIKIRTVNKEDIDQLLEEYEKNFSLNISRKQYILTFFSNEYSLSHIAVNETNSIIGHTGISIGNLKCNSGQIAFRFSTFINKEYRGKGLYKEMMEKVLYNLNINNIYILFTWPNPINLASCLKDTSYNYLPPQTTFEYKFKTDIDIEAKNYQLNYSLISKNDTSLELIELIRKEYSRTKNSLQEYTLNKFKNRLFRNQKVSYYIIYKDKEIYSLIGFREKSNEQMFCALHINKLDLNELKNIIINIIKNDFIFHKEVILQLWVSHTNREGIRSAIKSGMRETGPLFYRGYYIIQNQQSQEYTEAFLKSTSMFDNDAF